MRGRWSTRRWRPWTGDDAAAGNGSEGRRGGAEGGEAKKQRAGALLPGGWGGSRWRRPGTGRGGHGSSKEGGGWSWSPAMEAEQRTGEAEEPMADAGGRARRHGEATTRRREGCRGSAGRRRGRRGGPVARHQGRRGGGRARGASLPASMRVVAVLGGRRGSRDGDRSRGLGLRTGGAAGPPGANGPA